MKFRKEFDYRLVGTSDQLSVDRNANEQRAHAFGNGPHVVLGRCIKIELSLRHAPRIIVAGEILLEHQLAMTDDDYGMNVGIGGRESGRNAAETCTVEPNVLGVVDWPTVIEVDGPSAGG